MQKILVAVLFWITLNTVFAQKPIDSLQAAEDFEVLENILKKGHPSLYTYMSSDDLDLLFKTAKKSLSSATTDIEVFKKMVAIGDKIKDGTLLFFAPKSIKTDQYFFPLILKSINTELYTDTDDFGIPVGSKIDRINQKNVSKILEKLKKYAPSDGFNLTRKYRSIESKFGFYYIYEYGIEKQFCIDYTTPNGEKHQITLAAEPQVTVKLRSAKRNSYFAKYHQQDAFDFFTTNITNKDPFVYYKNELKTAVLIVNSFAGDVALFKAKLENIFKEIEEKKISHLIIDVRNTDSGFRPNAIQLFSCIAKKPFRQITNEYVVSLSVPEREHATRIFLNEKEFLKTKYSNHPQYDGWKLTFDDLETIMVPLKNRFKGKVYVLTSGTTFATGATFALDAKNDPDITLIGEETGGGYYFTNGRFPVYYELPNSKIGVLLSMVQINQYTKDKTIPVGSGIPPDKHIKLSIESLINGKDPQLDYVFRLIKG